MHIAGAEIVNQIDKTPVFMKRQKREDNYNWTWGNRQAQAEPKSRVHTSNILGHRGQPV